MGGVWDRNGVAVACVAWLVAEVTLHTTGRTTRMRAPSTNLSAPLHRPSQASSPQKVPLIGPSAAVAFEQQINDVAEAEEASSGESATATLITRTAAMADGPARGFASLPAPPGVGPLAPA